MARILVADDVADVRNLLRTVLEQDQHEIIEADTGQKVLNLVRDDAEPSFDLILLDIVLPDIEGIEVLRQLKTMERSLPKVCFISGKRDKEVVVRALQTGGDDYLVKPIDIMVLRDKLQKLVGTTTSEMAGIATHLQASLVGSPVEVPLVITKLSETGLVLESSIPFKEHSTLELSAKTLDHLLGAKLIMTCMVESISSGKDGGQSVTVSFTGMHENQRSGIRRLVIAGKELSDEED